ncbi:MAG TPA: hypothetical protein VJ718_11090, partial [Candidatus Binataceae bacterium]|nr:hypothetical protein [Candidatus Binataceae bacterium]
MAGQHPVRHELQRADHGGFVDMLADWHDLDFRAVALQLNRRAADHQFADAATAKATPDGDALGSAPILQPQKARDDRGELAGIRVDDAEYQAGRLRFVAVEEFCEILLGEGACWRVGQRIAAPTRACFAPFLENRGEGGFVGTIAILLAAIAELGAIGIDMDARQRDRAMQRHARLWRFLVLLALLVL